MWLYFALVCPEAAAKSREILGRCRWCEELVFGLWRAGVVFKFGTQCASLGVLCAGDEDRWSMII